MNKMAVNFNMLGAFMKNWILGNVKRGLAITKQVHSLRMKYTEGGKESF